MPRSPADPVPAPESEIGVASLWLLRVTAAVFLLVLGWFLVDAIVG